MKNKVFLFGMVIGIAISYLVDTITDLILKIIMVLNS